MGAHVYLLTYLERYVLVADQSRLYIPPTFTLYIR